MDDPTGSLLVVVNVNTMFPVVLTVAGLKLMSDWLNAAGVRLTAALGSLEE